MRPFQAVSNERIADVGDSPALAMEDGAASARSTGTESDAEWRLREVGRPAVAKGATSGFSVASLALPQRARKRDAGGFVSFLICVVLPVIAASVYFFAFASDQYVTGFKFTVRDAQSSAPSSLGALPALLGVGPSSNPLENYIVTDYLTSRQAVEDIQAKINVTKLYSRPGIDWWARFNPAQPIERFVIYWQRMVTASYDQVTGLSSAEVRAFTPDDTYLIASTLVTFSEELINRIANKGLRDAVRFAETDVQRAETRLKAVRGQITDFRNKEQVIDPTAGVVTSNVLLAQTLRANLSQLQTQLSALTKQNLSSTAPAAVFLQSQIKATREELATVEAQVGHMTEGSTPLSQVVGQFEQLTLESQFAQNMVVSAMQNLELARTALYAQHIYVTTYVDPAVPQSSLYPKRILSVCVTGFVCLLFWTIGLLTVRSVREHLA